MNNLFINTGPLFQVAVVVMLLVLLAMIIDLGAGLYKAKQRGELRTSEALRRTLSKFISYEGGLAIAVMVDVLISFAKFFELLGLLKMSSVPVVTILVGIFLLIVEFMSVREKADQKTKKQQKEAAELIGKILTKEDIAAVLQFIVSRNNPQQGEEVNNGEM